MKEHEATGTCQKKSTKLRNLIYKTEAFDSLHAGNAEVMKEIFEIPFFDLFFYFLLLYIFYVHRNYHLKILMFNIIYY